MHIRSSIRAASPPHGRRSLSRRAALTLSGLVLLSWLLSGMGTAGAAPTTVTQKNNPSFGTILADSTGRTLYTLTNNGQPVLCTAVCAVVWPPLTVPPGTHATAPSGVCCIGTTTNANGDAVTYQGEPLYRFANDSSPSDANGDGVVSFGGTWHVVRVSSSATTPTTTATTATTTGGSGTATAVPTTAVAAPAPAVSSGSARSASAVPLGSPGTGGTPPGNSDTPQYVGIGVVVAGVGWALAAHRRSRGAN